MELAKVTTKGQITIPKAIREKLDLKEGSKIIFLQKGNDIIIKNSAMLALEKIQDEFEGEADRLDIKSEQEVVKLIKKFRKERKSKWYDDYIILHTAIIEDVDVFITGDKDFFEVIIDRPEIMSVSDFLNKYRKK